MSAGSFKSLVELLEDRVRETPDREAMYGRRGDGWYTLHWREVGERVRRIGCGLHALDLAKGERVAILAMSRPEWVMIDFGILGAAGATSTIYTSNTPDECAYILEDSGAVICFVENAEQHAKLAAERARLGHVRKVVWIDGEPPAGDDWCMSLAALEEAGTAWDGANPGRYDEITAGLTRSDLATLIYTSGTTGRPKGVMLSHANWLYEAEALEKTNLMLPEDKQYLFLPLAHSFAKALEVVFIRAGTPTAIDGDVEGLIANLPKVQPTVMAAVPRVFEKVYNKVVAGAQEAGGLKAAIFGWAIGVGKQVSALRQNGQEPSGLLAIKYALANKLVFAKLRAVFGGRIRFFVSGGAPLARELAEFFHAADLLILEGYGLTETSAGAFINRPDAYKFGSVGPALPGTDVKIAADGEILMRGGGIMQGYYNRPEDTAEVLAEDGWFASGDIGQVDEKGFLTITDRKKDLIVTAGGKNVAPQFVENLIKTSTPLVSQVVMLGDRRPYCIALVTINADTVGSWAKERGIETADYAELAARDEVHELLWGEIDAVNGRLASYEQIKKIRLLPNDFSPETGELTPKMSVKRKVVEGRYSDLIEEMYAGKRAAAL